jgi:L-alanine-DL-glutamate epimerase-like enolase superfamily enzyme
MAAVARRCSNAKAIKLKLTGEPIDSDRVRAVREAMINVWLGIDANQGFNRASLEELLPVLVSANVALIEQPFPIGDDALLDGFHSPIPIAADESVQTIMDIPKLIDRYQIVNIKLDKCGGLTAGLAMGRAARACGLQTMIGSMMGTSLAVAPAFVVGQFCDVVDLDGPLFLSVDRENGSQYHDGLITCPESFWGGSGIEQRYS